MGGYRPGGVIVAAEGLGKVFLGAVVAALLMLGLLYLDAFLEDKGVGADQQVRRVSMAIDRDFAQTQFAVCTADPAGSAESVAKCNQLNRKGMDRFLDNFGMMGALQSETRRQELINCFKSGQTRAGENWAKAGQCTDDTPSRAN